METPAPRQNDERRMSIESLAAPTDRKEEHADL